MEVYLATTEAARSPRAHAALALMSAGYRRTNMGGNIEAWLLKFGAGDLLITEDDADGTWTVMLYGIEHSEPIDSLCAVPLADAIEAGEVFRLRAAGCNA
jgi:imidazole glycerol phosphate synthase subunit HisF